MGIMSTVFCIKLGPSTLQNLWSWRTYMHKISHIYFIREELKLSKTQTPNHFRKATTRLLIPRLHLGKRLMTPHSMDKVFRATREQED